MERALNVMENSLNNVESDPMISHRGDDGNNNDPFTDSYRNNLWRGTRRNGIHSIFSTCRNI